MNKLRSIAQGFSVLMVLCVLAVATFAQTTTGGVRGTVTDPNGAVVPNAKVTISQKSTNTVATTQSNGDGAFQFSNLLVGDDYSIKVEAANFKTLTLSNVKIQLNQVADINAQLTVGLSGEVVEVTAGGAELVDTNSNNLSSSYSSKQVVELAQTGVGAGVNNLSLLAANVSSSGGVGVGTGGSVGGQRPRNNNFVLDGVDNNDKAVTGPQSYISPEEVAEFSLLQNQFSAEYGRSNGGQFITVTKSGGKDYHGAFYGGFRNRYFDALDQLQIQSGFVRQNPPPAGKDFMPRYDYFRGGFNLGGPFPGIFFHTVDGQSPKWRSKSDKVFFFVSYERLQNGQASSPGGIQTPTAAGRTLINGIAGLSTTNRNQFMQFVPIASTQDRNCGASGNQPCTILVRGVTIPIGSVTFPAPNFFKQNHVVANVDYNQSSTTQHRFRFTMTNGSSIDTAANLPIFFTPFPTKQRLYSYTLIHNFTSNLIDETRLAFRHSSYNAAVPAFGYPGLDAFPNIGLDDLGLNIGPDGNAPQFGIEGSYQVVNNLTWLTGNHAFKFGGDFRNIISPQHFVQRERGDYEYINTEDFLLDSIPVFGERNAGGGTYYGNQHLLYAFAQDDWKVRSNLTLNLGVNWAYQQVPTGNSQAKNSISSVPGVLVFNNPKTQKTNFAPKVGFAYSPNYESGILGRIFGSGGKSSLRAGFSMGYDYIFDNIYVLSNPPQLQQTRDVGQDPTGLPGNFLATGGISGAPAVISSPAAARAATTSWIPDQKVPYSLTWTGSFQRQFGKDWSVELRYLGTKGVHLLTQNRINVLAKVAPDQGRPGLPTFLTAPSQATINALALDLGQISARPQRDPFFTNAGFTGNVVAFLSNGNSTYHAASAQLTRRFARGLQMTAAYTWSHLIDDTTAEVFSTVLSPRRVQDFRNLTAEKANSALDHRHRFVTSINYELPFFKDGNGWAKAILGGFNLAGTYSYESGEFVTIRSGTDANLNGDSAGDRAILNPSGAEGTASAVTALLRTCTVFNKDLSCAQSNASRTVGYLATTPGAKYIQAGSGAVSTMGRNTFRSPSINNIDFSVFKSFRFGEGKAIQYRVDFFNALNHPQYTAGSVNSVDPVSNTGITQYNAVAPLTGDFLKADHVLSSHPRVIQMALKFSF